MERCRGTCRPILVHSLNLIVVEGSNLFTCMWPSVIITARWRTWRRPPILNQIKSRDDSWIWHKARRKKVAYRNTRILSCLSIRTFAPTHVQKGQKVKLRNAPPPNPALLRQEQCFKRRCATHDRRSDRAWYNQCNRSIHDWYICPSIEYIDSWNNYIVCFLCLDGHG